MKWRLFGGAGLSMLVIGFFLLPLKAAADSGTTITLNPAAVYVTLAPDTSTSGSLELTNSGTNPFTYQAYVRPYSVTNYVYSPVFVRVPGRPDASQWITLNYSGQTTIAPDKTVQLNYVIKVPKLVPAGGYYAVAFAETQQPKTPAGIHVTDRVGCIFYLQVAGNAKESGSVEQWRTPFIQSDPPSSSLELVNTGSIDYISHVSLTLRDLLGNPKSTYQTQKIVLPQTIRAVSVHWPRVALLSLVRVSGSASVFGTNQVLPTKYVLVISRPARYIAGVIVAVLFIQSLLRYYISRKKVNRSL